jgi:mannose/cellobiose epimerase-like protein (N-acyl-D-glucosamine 2-epimerase family)/6-phosphogluconolactonase/glucosamine-6-phosphate isomerase/deaminase
MKNFKAGSLNVKLLKDRDEVGRVGAADVADAITAIIAKKGSINIIFAAAASQNEFLKYLAQDERIDWSKVSAFNMDEYIGIRADHPETFGNYLKRSIYDKVKPGRIELFNTMAPDPQAECERYAALLEENPADIVLFGVGETCHLAFNDPPEADFNDPLCVKAVNLDEMTWEQMVHDGCFETVQEVPKQAYTITIPIVMNAPRLFGMVPGKTKVDTIWRTLNEEISTRCPSSILRTHPNATMYIDEDSAERVAMGENYWPQANLATNKEEIRNFLKTELLDRVMPFWTENCVDNRNGGINNIVTNEGKILSDDKLFWSQGRALWLFSTLYKKINPDPKFREIADGIADLILRARRSDGAWDFSVKSDGTTLDARRSTYVDGFVCMGLTEYANMTGKTDIMNTAVEVFMRNAQLLKSRSESVPVYPFGCPAGIQALAPLLLWVKVAFDLGKATGNKEILNYALCFAKRIVIEHTDVESGFLFDYIIPGGGTAPGDLGKSLCPGHVIECMWFVEEVFNYFKETELQKKAIELGRRHLEYGWDWEYGGVIFAKHTQGATPIWHNPTCKSWWPQCESLYFLMRSYELTGEEWCLKWFERVWDYTFSHFPYREYGDWLHDLNREGRQIDMIALIKAKDPFHLPRALINMMFAIDRMSQ